MLIPFFPYMDITHGAFMLSLQDIGCAVLSFVTYVHVIAVRASGNMVGIFCHMYFTIIAKPDV